MNTIIRKECLITGEKLETIHTFHDFPIHMGVTKKEEKDDLRSDMVIKIGEKSGVIQLGELIPEDILYVDAHYNSIGIGWEVHHRAFANFISKYKPKNVFEIGGGRGFLEKYYCEQTKETLDWTILEPVPNPIEGCNAKFVKGFFNKDYKIPEGYDTVVHSHTLEHFYNPIEFIRAISENMKDDTFMFFSVPNMREMLARCFTNIFNFEHTYYCAEPFIEYMLNKCGYSIIEKKDFGDDHSVFYATIKKRVISESCLSLNYYKENKMLMQKYINMHQEIVRTLNTAMTDTSRPIYLFGAHVFSQFLIGFGLDTGNIKGVLDNDPSKWGARLCGTSLWVESPGILQKENNPIVILRAGTHNNEIKQDILQNINKDTLFWE